MDIKKSIKLLVFSLAIFSLIINLAYYFYLQNYENEHYGKYNMQAKEEFIQNITSNNIAADKIDFTPWCLNLKPDQFIATSGVLDSWSGLILIVSTIFTIVFIIFARKKLSKRYIIASIIILFISFAVFFQIVLFDAGYNYIGCKPF